MAAADGGGASGCPGGRVRLRIQGIDLWDDGVEDHVFIDGKHVHTTERQKSALGSFIDAVNWVEEKHPELANEVKALCAAPW